MFEVFAQAANAKGNSIGGAAAFFRQILYGAAMPVTQYKQGAVIAGEGGQVSNGQASAEHQRQRKKQTAGTLSGGEQQMLAMWRALMAKPEILLLDEPSMGLAPLLVREIFEIIKNINSSGTTILLVEQNAKMALSIADRAYVLETGSIVMSGTGEELAGSDEIQKAYLGGE